MTKETKVSNTTEDKPVKKRPRKKLMSASGPLSCKPIEGYHLRWANINDPGDPMNISNLLERGYTFVTPEEQGLTKDNLGDLASVIEQNTSSQIIRTGRDNISCTLMKLPNEYAQEDLKELKQHNDAAVDALLKPKAKNEMGLQEFGESHIDGRVIK